jgi:hypothetical protein
LPFALLQATAPAAFAPIDMTDARCVFLYGYFGSRGTPEQANQAKLGTMYFVGRIRGRNPATDLGKLLAAAMDEAKRANINAKIDVARCEREFQAAAIALMGGAIAAKAPANPPASIPRKP